MKSVQITIPEPCQEDWDKMSQREQGRFCDKCSKTVHDFSGQTDRQIGQFISAHANEKICGRFRSDQLARPVILEIPVQSIGSRLTPVQAFLAALLIVFGTTLFSCKTPGDEAISKIQLTGTVVPPVEWTSDSSRTRMMVGGFIAEPPAPVKAPERLLGDTVITVINEFMKGDVIVDLPEVTVTAEVMSEVTLINGGLAYSIIDEANETLPPEPDVSESHNTIEALETPARQALIYPNPAHDRVRVRIYITEEEDVEVRLLDLEGRLIRVVAAGSKMQAGENELEFDASGLPRAVYLLQISVGLHEETKRLILN